MQNTEFKGVSVHPFLGTWGTIVLVAAPSSLLSIYVALRTPTKGEPVGTCNRSIRKSQRINV